MTNLIEYQLVITLNMWELVVIAGLTLGVLTSWIYHVYRNMNLTNELHFTKARFRSAQEEAEGWWKRYCEAKGIGGK